MVNIVDSPFRVRAKDRKISINTMQKEGIFVQKLRKMQKKLLLNVVCPLYLVLMAQLKR